PTHWALTGTLAGAAVTGPPGSPNPMFGKPVTLQGGVAAIGVPADAWVDNVTVSGAIHVFRPDATGTWARTETLRSLDASPSDQFGAAFAFAGDVLVVGAPGKAVTLGGQGAAYVFHRDDSTTDDWYQAVRFTATDAALLDGFGSAIAIHDQTAFVG